ncbi:AAA family ATPase [Pseudoalteromonas sp.]|uniref:AAA family ATPase n=1 Tax=Pseudoalteromonas sp. TaxID=53249 RepID=UPI003003021B
MLKRFRLTNFSSFDAEQTLDLTAGTTKSLKDHVVNFGSVNLLKNCVIYGANASGKSNLIKAIDFSQRIITEGLDSTDTYKKHFRLKTGNSHLPTKFEFELEVNKKFYSYSFSCILQEGLITEEWLYEIGTNKAKKIFERNLDGISIGSEISKSNNNTRFEIYIDDMKNQNSQLFLSEIAEKDLDIVEASVINDVFNWFENKLEIIYPGDSFCGVRRVNKDLTKELTKYLSKFDTGVVSIDTIEEDFEDAFKNYPDGLKAQILKSSSSDEFKEASFHAAGDNPEFLTIYRNKSSELKVRKLAFIHGHDYKDTFELKDESDGTRRLLDFIPLIAKLAVDSTIIVDEFDRSLHPKITREFMNIFHALKGTNSQFIVTTHESTLLDLELLRRDEIWFVDKSKNGNSKLFSLNKFKERYDKKVEKAYLLGRYGAVPVFKSFENVNWDE